MMARTRFLWINIFSVSMLTGLSLSSVGQTQLISGIVSKKGTSEVLPYVSIAVKNTSRGTISDLKGSFSIGAKASDSILVSSVGYQKLTIAAGTIPDTLYLEEEISFLTEISISSTKRSKKINIGNLKEKTILATGGANQYAKLFPNQMGSDGILESITLSFQPEAKKYGRYMTAIMVRVYENTNGLPGGDLLFQNVIVPIKENQNQVSVDLSKFNISFPSQGLFIGFDFVGYYDGSEVFTPYSKLNTPANLRVEFAKNNDADTFSRFFGTKWQKVLHTDRDGNNHPISSKMRITVSY